MGRLFFFLAFCYPENMNNSIFVNLPIENLGKSVEFFSELGFTFNPQFTSEDTTCMIVGENIFVMLLEKARFSTFVDKPIAARNSVESLIALSCESTVREITTLMPKSMALVQ